MKYDTLLFLRTPGQELLHSIIRFLYLKEAISTKEELNCLILFSVKFTSVVLFSINFHINSYLCFVKLVVILF